MSLVLVALAAGMTYFIIRAVYHTMRAIGSIRNIRTAMQVYKGRGPITGILKVCFGKGTLQSKGQKGGKQQKQAESQQRQRESGQSTAVGQRR